jgi:hypothetical protein
MKLFITNKEYFEELFTRDDYRDGFYLTPKQIHQKAFNELKLSLDVEHSIPLCLTPEYKDWGCAIFDFVTKKGDVYYYEFTTTAS